MYRQFDVVITYIEFTDGNGGKKRPAVVTSVNGEELTLRKITSQYHNKSEHIKKKYYEIKDWAYSKLKKPSWVDVNPPMIFDTNSFKIEVIGEFSARDIIGLQNFLEERGEDL